MPQGLRRLGRLGVFVTMAGVSWLVEACSNSSDDDDPTRGGAGGGTDTGSGGGTNVGGTGGTTSGGTGGTAAGGQRTGTGGEAGLYDLPCE